MVVRFHRASCLAGSIRYMSFGAYGYWENRLRGEKCLMAVVSQTPALNPAKNPWFYSDNVFMLQFALGSQTF